jgi:prolyl oligopeptidase
MAGERTFTVLFEPSDTTSLAGYSFTANHLVLNVLEDVKNRLSVLTPPGGATLGLAAAARGAGLRHGFGQRV